MDPPHAEVECLLTYDQMLRQRGFDEDQTPLLAYPKSQFGSTDYEPINGKTLDRFVDGGVKALMKAGLGAVYEETVVGVYSPTDLEYLVTIFALGRLGYTSFLISPRLPASAVGKLLEITGAHVFLHSKKHHSLANGVSKHVVDPLTTMEILSRSSYDVPVSILGSAFSRPNIDNRIEQWRPYIMLHSSGSTGLPKPVAYTNARLLLTVKTSPGLIAFQSLPFSHAHGLATYSQAIHGRKTQYLFNGHVPQTHDTLVSAIAAAKPEIVWTVPYVLKLLAEKEDGIEVLKKCWMVSSSGSRCPDDLGDLLTNAGVFLGLLFGSTEASQLFSSLTRPRDDKAWKYLRPLPQVLPYLLMRLVGDGVYECIVLDGLKTKAMTNSNNPPNSFHTSDLFVPHPTIHDAWKFVGRSDDRVTLLNGEKVLPLPIEGSIVQNLLVKDAVVFGIDRPVPSLLLFQSKAAAGMTAKEVLDHVWPTIENANKHSEAFSQIHRDMIVVIPDGVDYPSTDKGSVKRAQVNREFESVINNTYDCLENGGTNGVLRMTISELEDWILSNFHNLGISLPDTTSDFFAAGVDSLKAIQMRGLIIKNIDLNKHRDKLPSMIVYDCGNILSEYSHLPDRVMGVGKCPTKANIILTGATGSLGSHILRQLVTNSHVEKVLCLIRTFRPEETASARLALALGRACGSELIDSPKVIALSADFTKSDFALSRSDLASLQSTTTHIIHCAWPVNFALPLSSFSPQLACLHNLLALSLSVPFPEPAFLLFCSSVGAAMGTPPPASILESPLELSKASPTGYARSKLVAEQIVENAVNIYGAKATILRIGQIIPSQNQGSKLWNPNEVIPLAVHSSAVLGVLPSRMASGDRCTWLEADVAAGAVIDICKFDERNLSGPRLVYNLVHPKSFSWRKEFLPALRAAGLVFETVSYNEWLERLSQSSSDLRRNPSRKLLQFWRAQKFEVGDSVKEIRFETMATERTSPVFAAVKLVVTKVLIEGLTITVHSIE